MPEPKIEQLQSLNIDQLAKQRNWDSDEKQEVEDLFNQLEGLLSGRTYQQIWDAYEKEQTEERKKELEQIISVVKDLVNIIEKNEFPGLDTIIGETTDGQEIKFEIAEKLEEWKEFYEDHEVDWVDLPEEITITKEQQQEMARVISELKPEKQEDIGIIIIPEGLADDGEKYEKLHKLMTEGYKKSFQCTDFKEVGGLAGLKNKSNSLRIIITKRVQNLKDDEVFKQTLDKSVNDLEEENGLFEKTGLRGLDMMTYFILQRKYFKETKKHLDELNFTCITETVNPLIEFYCKWEFGDRISFGIMFYCDVKSELGCRLAGSFEIKQ